MLQSQVLCLIKSFQLLCIVHTLKIPAELPSIQPLKFCVPMYLNVALLSLRFDSRYLLCCCYVTSVVSNSVRPHRRQPTRLLCPWDSPGKNTGVGCHACMHAKLLQLCASLWTAAYQAPLSMGFSRQEYWRGLPFPSPRHLLYTTSFHALLFLFLVTAVIVNQKALVQQVKER